MTTCGRSGPSANRWRKAGSPESATATKPSRGVAVLTSNCRRALDPPTVKLLRAGSGSGIADTLIWSAVGGR